MRSSLNERVGNILLLLLSVNFNDLQFNTELFNDVTDEEWKLVIELSQKQGVIALAFESYQRISKLVNSRPSDIDIMRWYGYTNLIKQNYNNHPLAELN